MSSLSPRSHINRRDFLRGVAAMGGMSAMGPIHALGLRVAMGFAPAPVKGYGPLINKGDLWLPREFNYQIVSRQGAIMADGSVMPGIFDGMGAFPGGRNAEGCRQTVLIRNHENRELPDETRVVTAPGLEYDDLAFGGNTKLIVERKKSGSRDALTGRALYQYEVVSDFAILGGTTTNCAGGQLPYKKWVTCEEVVKRSTNGKKHGYVFEIDSTADGPVPAVPIVAAGRFGHEAAAWRNGVLYLTEDRSIVPDTLLGSIGACFYRFIPDRRQFPSSNLAFSGGKLQALKLKGEIHANMDTGRVVGFSYLVDWVTVDEPDHDDDTDDNRNRIPGMTPTRIQAQDKGAAYFDRLEGAWATGSGSTARIYFDCTTGGPANLGQIWEYNPSRSVLTLIYQSSNPSTLRNPDNVVIVPHTHDIFLCEDTFGDQSIRGLTRHGEIYDFARSITNATEFCGACFDPMGHTLYVNQQGARGSLPDGPPGAQAVTYAIYGPFGKRAR
jgi:secreted PhoX family phosphatase